MNDIQFIPANIDGYQDIPTSLYPTLPSTPLAAVAINRIGSVIVDGVLADGSNDYVTWTYPTTDNLFIRVAVGYQLQVLQGTFAFGDSQSTVAPGTVVLERIVQFKNNIAPVPGYVNLQSGATDRLDIPAGTLQSGTKYTVRVRALVFSE